MIEGMATYRMLSIPALLFALIRESEETSHNLSDRSFSRCFELNMNW